jgi:hypothetical protein
VNLLSQYKVEDIMQEEEEQNSNIDFAEEEEFKHTPKSVKEH